MKRSKGVRFQAYPQVPHRD